MSVFFRQDMRWLRKNIINIFIIIILLECTLFNLRHWTTLNESPRVNIFNYEITLSDSVERFEEGYIPTAENAEMTISNINENIRTVFLQPLFNDVNIKKIDITIKYQDENNIQTYTTQLINGYEPSFYIPLGAMGKVQNLTIVFLNKHVGIQEILLNEPLPWSFKLIRVVLLTFAVAIAFFWKKYRFSDIKFAPQLKWQKGIDVFMLLAYIGVLFFVVIFSVDFGYIPNSNNELKWNPSRSGQHGINDRVVDALLLGQFHLDMIPHESLLNATQPYSPAYRSANNIIAPWDHVFFKGKFYSYFGIVPVLILFLPYYLLVGHYLSATTATLIFSSFGIIGLYLLWKELVKKYMKNLPYVIYLAGLVAVLFGSNLMTIAVRAHQYEAAISSGLMFSVWGLFFIFRAIRDDSCDRIKPASLFFSGVCLALAVGCRPPMLLVSLIVPVLLVPFFRSFLLVNNSNKKLRKILVFKMMSLVIPYIVIGIGLMWYNYARFGSIIEFGTNYMITNVNISVLTQTGILGNLRRIIDGVFSFLFTNFSLTPYFPYVHATNSLNVFTGRIPRTPVIGVMALPITWFLFFIINARKSESVKRAAPLIFTMIATALSIMIFSSVTIGIMGRYTLDFFWLFILASAMCAGLIYEEAIKRNDLTMAISIRRLSLIAVLLTCIIMFGWGMVGENNYIWENNPVVIRYLSDLFTIF